MNIKTFLENNPIIAIVMAVWLMALLTFVVLGVFFFPPEGINAAFASIVGAIFGIVGGVMAYVTRRLDQ